MATISYNFNVVNGSGAYTVQVKNCSGTSTIYTHNITGQATTGTVNGTLSDASLNGDLGSVKLSIYDSNNNSVINTSGCFNHNCASCVSVTDFTLSTTSGVDFAVNFDCSITGVDGDSPHSYYFTLKQNGSVIATNTDNSLSNFTFTNNLCPNAGTITVDASVVNCGGTVNKTNTITVNAVSPPAPVLTVCYLGSTQWRFNAAVGLHPETLVALYAATGDVFVGYFNPVSSVLTTLTVESPSIGGDYYAKTILCGVSSGASNYVTVGFSPSC